MATATFSPSDPVARQRPLARARDVARLAWTYACLATILGAVLIVLGAAWYDLTPLAVESGSMEPTLPIHSLILVGEARPQDVHVGDIITFDPPGPTPRVTHRVVARERVEGSGWYFWTKGDANPAPDDWRRGMDHPERYKPGVTYGDDPAVRHVATIPYAGLISTLVPSRVRLALLLLPLAWVGVRLLVAIWLPRRPGGPGAQAPRTASPREIYPGPARR
jgi:signal peptidase